MQSVNMVHGNSRVIKHGKTAHPALIPYNVDGQISLACLRDVFRLLYENKPFGELRAQIAALSLRLWYLAQKYGRRLNSGIRKHLPVSGLHPAR